LKDSNTTTGLAIYQHKQKQTVLMMAVIITLTSWIMECS